jgi:ParB family chromosome partitioning protein
VPEAGSCANCPKRTGFNTLLFSEVREDSCADAACFNRKLDAHIAQRVAVNLVFSFAKLLDP